jgi:hypothetical protein
MEKRVKSDIEIALDTISNPKARPLEKELARRLLEVATVNSNNDGEQPLVKKTGDENGK